MNKERKSMPPVQESENCAMDDNFEPNANVDAEGHCILAQTGEMARPDTGDPCEDGRDAK